MISLAAIWRQQIRVLEAQYSPAPHLEVIMSPFRLIYRQVVLENPRVT
ncbi:hypothetical protein HNR39_002068 [Glaciimonas immobilis]|uniref:Uncharacterized protein n=1 Tax=Glaciimonas immobilis TaxID=728004 RepID=A0A840RRA5_9BURK|nr:hypothetical protein [Glaciimonas immobilis]